MTAATVLDRRESELWRRLGEVDDPELDEPITDLGFVGRADLFSDGSVEVDFRLPTYWCSPNFAFLMLDGIRNALESLSWSPPYRVTLQDHVFAEEVNRGIAEGRSFSAIFDELAKGEDLDALRETFRIKAFKRRQEAVIVALRGRGLTDGTVAALEAGALDRLRLDTVEERNQLARYRRALRDRFPDHTGDDQAFLTWEGDRIEPEALSGYLAELRGIRLSMEFNGALCRGLQQTRYKELGTIDGEPTLVDFMLDRVPERSSQPN